MAEGRYMARMRDLVVSEAIMAAAGVAIVWLRHGAGLVWVAGGAGPAAAGTAVALSLVVALALGAALSVVALRTPLARYVAEALEPLSGIRFTLANCIVAGLLAGVGEELLFRAALQPWLGIWVASALFALAHAGQVWLEPGVTPAKIGYPVYALVAGLALGATYARFGLAPAIVAHAAYDAIELWMLRGLIAPVTRREGTPPAA